MSDTTPIRIMCPNLLCRKVLAVPPHARGRTVRCKACATNIRIPDGSPETKDAPKSEDAEAA